MERILTPETPRSSIKDAYALLGANTPLELNNLYTEEDQKLMNESAWDYKNPDLVINKVKEILEDIDATTLSEDEKAWRNEILWFWNHHAISCAIWRHNDLKAAQKFSDQALQFQSENHPNQITKLLYFLTHHQLDLAEEWLSKIGEEEKETAEYLMTVYKEGRFGTNQSS